MFNMNDSENQTYCSTHGCLLDNERFCEKCNYKKSFYFENRMAQNNKLVWTNEFWIKNILDKNPNNLCNFCVCHNCKYFMFHSLIYCPKCPNKMSTEMISYKEFHEKYKDYKQGY